MRKRDTGEGFGRPAQDVFTPPVDTSPIATADGGATPERKPKKPKRPKDTAGKAGAKFGKAKFGKSKFGEGKPGDGKPGKGKPKKPHRKGTSAPKAPQSD